MGAAVQQHHQAAEEAVPRRDKHKKEKKAKHERKEEAKTAAPAPAAATSTNTDGALVPITYATVSNRETGDSHFLSRRINASGGKVHYTGQPKITGSIAVAGRMKVPAFLQHVNEVHASSSKRALVVFLITGATKEAFAANRVPENAAHIDTGAFHTLCKSLGDHDRVGYCKHDDEKGFNAYIIPPISMLADPNSMATQLRGKPGPAAFLHSHYGYGAPPDDCILLNGGSKEFDHKTAAYIVLEFRPGVFNNMETNEDIAAAKKLLAPPGPPGLTDEEYSLIRETAATCASHGPTALTTIQDQFRRGQLPDQRLQFVLPEHPLHRRFLEALEAVSRDMARHAGPPLPPPFSHGHAQPPSSRFAQTGPPQPHYQGHFEEHSRPTLSHHMPPVESYRDHRGPAGPPFDHRATSGGPPSANYDPRRGYQPSSGPTPPREWAPAPSPASGPPPPPLPSFAHHTPTHPSPRPPAPVQPWHAPAPPQPPPAAPPAQPWRAPVPAPVPSPVVLPSPPVQIQPPPSAWHPPAGPPRPPAPAPQLPPPAAPPRPIEPPARPPPAPSAPIPMPAARWGAPPPSAVVQQPPPQAPPPGPPRPAANSGWGSFARPAPK
jgi:hypothetical protein